MQILKLLPDVMEEQSLTKPFVPVAALQIFHALPEYLIRLKAVAAHATQALSNAKRTNMFARKTKIPANVNVFVELQRTTVQWEKFLTKKSVAVCATHQSQ